MGRGQAPLLSGNNRGAPLSKILQSVIGIVAVAFMFWLLAVEAMIHVDAMPSLAGIYPFLGVGALLAIFPFIFFIAFSSEFPNVSPLNPRDYIFLLNRVIQAVASKNRNSGKISAKDL